MASSIVRERTSRERFLDQPNRAKDGQCIVQRKEEALDSNLVSPAVLHVPFIGIHRVPKLDRNFQVLGGTNDASPMAGTCDAFTPNKTGSLDARAAGDITQPAKLSINHSTGRTSQLTNFVKFYLLM